MVRNIIRNLLIQEDHTTKDGDKIVFERSVLQGFDHFFPWIVLVLTAKVNGVKVGYLKISYIPKENWKKAYPTLFDFARKLKGHVVLEGWRDFSKKRLTDVLHVIVTGRWLNLPKEMDPESPELDDMLSSLKKKFKEKLSKDYRQTYNYHVEKPYVDFISVDDEWKRKGVATALYKEGTRWMAERGMLLHSSSTQSDSAKAVWKFMRSNYHHKKISNQSGEKTLYRYALDPDKLGEKK